MHESRGDVLACIAIAIGLYFVTVVPLMRLARADHLLPRVVREFPLTAAAFLLILTAQPEASRV
jgi:hypothetical protein